MIKPAAITQSRVSQAPSFREALRFWLKLGFISFGGPSGQIAIMHAELVEKRRWIREDRFLHALNFCMLLPGPEATQLATYIGWLLHGTPGGIAAGVLFILPSIFILWALSVVYAAFGTLAWVAAIFSGLKPAVLAIVVAAVLRIGQRALKTNFLRTMAVAAFAAIYFLKIPFPVIVFSAGLAGLIVEKFRKTEVSASAGLHAEGSPSDAANAACDIPLRARPTFRRAAKTFAITLALWFAPLVLIAATLGKKHTLFQEGVFFSKAAMVTFGGAYAVLPYVSQQAVERHNWLAPSEMLDGLGLAETTPGPLIMVLQFAGFMGAFHHPAPFRPLVAATLGALITTWSTFVPCFLWIFLGAPWIEKMRGNKKLAAALAGITAAVVGVIMNLAVWFGGHALFPPGERINFFGMAVAAIAFCGLRVWKWEVAPVALGAGLSGFLFHLLTRF
jgi:chromate transporter